MTDLLLGSVGVHGLRVEPDALQIADHAQRSAVVRLGVGHPCSGTAGLLERGVTFQDLPNRYVLSHIPWTHSSLSSLKIHN